MPKLDLGKQVGPMPLGAWIAVIGAGLGIAYYTRGGGGGDLVGSEDDALAGDETFVEDTSGDPGVGEGGFVFTPPPVVTGSPPPPVDNDEWGQRAIAGLITANYDPGWANAAITRALAQQSLSAREWTIWREALRRYGPPPFPIAVRPPKNIPSKHPPGDDHPHHEGEHHHHTEDRHRHKIGQAAATTKIQGDRWFRVRVAPLPGSTLRGIAKIAYGDPSKWRTIFAANQHGRELPRFKGKRRQGQLTNANHVPPGTLLYIPRG